MFTVKYILQEKENYEGSINIKHLGKIIRFYTKKQIRRMYPNRNYKVIGEIGNKEGHKINTVYTTDGTEISIYKKGSHNILIEKCIGYVEVEENIFLALISGILHI